MIKFLIIVSCTTSPCPIGSKPLKYFQHFPSEIECLALTGEVIESFGFKQSEFKIQCREVK